jgi:hypothetical protein
VTRMYIVEDESGLHELLGPSMAGDDQPYAYSKWTRILRFDVEDLEQSKPPESADERLQRVERVMLNATAEWLQITGRAEPPLPRSDVPYDLDEDAIEIRPIGRPNLGGQHVGVYAGVCAIYKPTGIAIVVDTERSQMRNKEVARGRLRGTLAALNELEQRRSADTLSEAERMRPVVEAAIVWRRQLSLAPAGLSEPSRALVDAVDAVLQERQP